MSKTTPSSLPRQLSNIFRTPRITTSIPDVSTPTKKTGSFHKLVTKFKENSHSKSFRARKEEYTSTVQLLAKYKMFPMIRDILEHQKNFTEITNELFVSRIIRLYGQAGMFDDARKLFDEMPNLNCPRTVYSFNTLLSAAIDSRKFDQIEGLLKELPSRPEITLDTISYNTVIKGFCRMGSMDDAVEYFELMLKKGVCPSVVTFNTLLWEFYSRGMFDDGEKVWEIMIEMNVDPNVRSYNAKLLGLALVKRVNEAVELIEKIRLQGVELSAHSFNFVIRGYVIDDNLEEVKRWYDELGKSDLVPHKSTYEIMIRFLCEKDDLGFAFEVCEQAFDRNCHVDVEVLQPVVDGLVALEKFEEAKKLVQLTKKIKYYSDRTLKLPAKV